MSQMHENGNFPPEQLSLLQDLHEGAVENLETQEQAEEKNRKTCPKTALLDFGYDPIDALIEIHNKLINNEFNLHERERIRLLVRIAEVLLPYFHSRKPQVLEQHLNTPQFPQILLTHEDTETDGNTDKNS